MVLVEIPWCRTAEQYNKLGGNADRWLENFYGMHGGRVIYDDRRRCGYDLVEFKTEREAAWFVLQWA